MYGLFFLLYLFGIAVVQTTVSLYIHVNQVFPDILLVMTVFTGLEWGKTRGLKWGFLIGLIADLASFGYLGMRTFTYSTTGFMCGFLREHFVYDSTPVRWTLVFLFSGVNGLVFYGFSRVALQVDLTPDLVSRFMIQAVLNVAVTTPVMALSTFYLQRVSTRFRLERQNRITTSSRSGW